METKGIPVWKRIPDKGIGKEYYESRLIRKGWILRFEEKNQDYEIVDLIKDLILGWLEFNSTNQGWESVPMDRNSHSEFKELFPEGIVWIPGNEMESMFN